MTARALAMLLVAALAAPACGSKPPRTGAKAGDKAGDKIEVELVVRSTSETNDGRPLHAVVRAVDRETYVADSYADVAALVTRKDESVLATFVVFPGHEHRQIVEVGKKTPIAVYALFTRPGKQWKTLLEHPTPAAVRIALSRHDITGQSQATTSPSKQ